MQDTLHTYQICRTCTSTNIPDEDLNLFNDLLQLLNDYYLSDEAINEAVYAHVSHTVIEAARQVIGGEQLCLIKDVSIHAK